MKKKAALTSLEIMINNALSLDTTAKKRLLDEAPQTIEICLSGHSFFLMLRPNYIELSTLNQTYIDVTLSSNLQRLIPLALTHKEKRKEAIQKAFDIEGDIVLAEKLEHIFTNLNPDWLSAISRFSNEGAALNLVEATACLKAGATQHWRSIKDNLNEFLHEGEISPHPLNVKAFLDDVDELSLNTDRVLAKFNQFKQTL